MKRGRKSCEIEQRKQKLSQEVTVELERLENEEGNDATNECVYTY